MREARPALSPAAVRLSDPVPDAAQGFAAPTRRQGKSQAVVQLGAYSSRDRVAAAWGKVSGKHGSLKRYVPVTARFTGAQGTVYRLSVKGFDSDREAVSLCASLKRAGAQLLRPRRRRATRRSSSLRANPSEAVRRSGGRGRPS